MSTHLLVIGAWHHEHKNTVSFDNKKQTGHLHQILTAQQKGHIYTNPSRPVVYSVSLHLTQDVDFNENMLMHRNMLVDNLRVFVAYQPDVAASTSHTWCTLHQPTFHFAFFVLRHHRHFYHYPQAQRERDIPTGSPLKHKHLLQKSSNDLTVRVFW